MLAQAEEFAALDFLNSEADAVRRALLEVGDGDAPADAKTRRAALAARGLTAALDRIEAAITHASDWPARSGAAFGAPHGSSSGNLTASVRLSYKPAPPLPWNEIVGQIIGGVIAAKIVPKMKDPVFMESFLDKGRMGTILKDMPVKIVVNDDCGMIGAARYTLVQKAFSKMSQTPASRV